MRYNILMDAPRFQKSGILAFIGYSDSGKTTVITELIRFLTGKGVRVAYLKRSHCDFQMDRKGKDTWKAGAAGAEWVGITSNECSAFLKNQPISLKEFRQLAPEADLIIVEGFSDEDLPNKIEVVRNPLRGLKSEGQGLLATVSPEPVQKSMPNFLPQEIDKLAGFIIDKFS